MVSPGIIVDSVAGRRCCQLRLATDLRPRGFPEETHTRVRATIHVERLPGDELRAVAREKRDSRSDIARVPNAPPRYQRVAELRCVARHVKVAGHLDDTGTDRVHPHVAWRQLDGQRSCEAD